MIWAILLAKYFLTYNIQERREPSLTRVRKALLWSEFIFLAAVCAAILILYVTLYIFKRNNSFILWRLILTLLVYFTVRYITIKKKILTGIILLFLMCCLIVWFLFVNIFFYSYHNMREYSSIQEMEQDIGEKFLIPSKTWDRYPADGNLFIMCQSHIRMPPYPLLKYPVPNNWDISGYKLHKPVNYDSKVIGKGLTISVDVKPYEQSISLATRPLSGYYEVTAEELSSQNDYKGNPYYCEEFEDSLTYYYAISFKHRGYVYIICVDTADAYRESSHYYGTAEDIARDIYRDLRYGE